MDGTPSPLAKILLGSTFGAALVLTFSSVAATSFLANVDLGGASARQRLARSMADPETTGSISRRAADVRLDPCRIAPRL